MKIEQEIMKMFDEELTKSIAEMIEYGAETKDFHNRIKSFISHIITLVQNREREEMVELITTHIVKNEYWDNDPNYEVQVVPTKPLYKLLKEIKTK